MPLWALSQMCCGSHRLVLLVGLMKPKHSLSIKKYFTQSGVLKHSEVIHIAVS